MKNRTPDRLFSAIRDSEKPFVFDEAVAEVFEDMINRSVPGYQTVLGMLGVMAEKYAQPETSVYDLGCSLGASTLMISQSIPDSCKLVALDNSAAMIKRCGENLSKTPRDRLELRCADIRECSYPDASLVVMNLTLQFIPPADRPTLLQSIYDGLRPEGALILFEKTNAENPEDQENFTRLYLDYKRANGYSELEISQKRTALENILIPDTPATLENRLRQAGFSQITFWFHCLQFSACLAIK